MIQLFERFQNMDRRWVFLGMALAIVIPLLLPFRLPFKVDERVQAAYDAVESLPSGSKVLVSADFDPGSRPELEPFYRAVLHHLFRKDHKVVMITLWETAPPLVSPIFKQMAAQYNKKEGVDWIFLGYKAGKELAIKSIGEDLLKTYPTDAAGRPTSDHPIMAGIRKAADFPLLVNISAGNPGTREYVLQIQGQYDIKMISSTTSVSGPDYIPYYKSGQLVGLAAGMPGSAQYEKLVFPDGATKEMRLMATEAMNVLSLGHLFIIGVVLLGNVSYFLTRKREA